MSGRGNKEVAGVGLAFVGFVIIVLGFKGTWGKVWHDLFGGGGVSANTAGVQQAPPSFGPSTPQNPTGLQPLPIPAGPGIKPGGPFQSVKPATPASTSVGLRLPNTFIMTPSGMLT